MPQDLNKRTLARPIRVAWRRKDRGMNVNVARLRSVSGLVLFAFVLTHLLNHALGLVSIEAMDAVQDARTAITRSALGTGILVLAALTHLVLGFGKLFQVQTWRVGTRSIVQLTFGLLLPILLIRHVVGTRGVHNLFGVEDDYSFVLWATWPSDGWNLAIMIALAWIHACVGLQNWFGSRSWYQGYLWLWYGLALLVPALAFSGFVSAARISLLESRGHDSLTPGQYGDVIHLIADLRYGYLAALGLALVAWALLLTANRLGSRVTVTYASGLTVHAPRGLSLLAISRVNNIPHASVCGGRARCSTCRVRVLSGQENIPAPSERELQVLKRVGAPANVRLACQLYPTGNISVSTLLPAEVGARGAQIADKYLWGIEQEVTIMFCDLRGFTSMTQGRLSYDVVFLLNQFLGRMAETIEDTGGFVDKFMGDGIMAIFGKDSTAREGARQAIAAARAMGGVLDALNQSLREALPAPLSMGIGLHTGSAILGRIGAAHQSETGAARLTALGDTVNLASRLEGKSKELDAQVVVSAACADRAGLRATAHFEPTFTDVRGFAKPVLVYSFRRTADMGAWELEVNGAGDPAAHQPPAEKRAPSGQDHA
jgi:adenylate cyclase